MKSIIRKIKKLTLLPLYLRLSITQAFKMMPDNHKKILFTLNDGKVYGEGANHGNDRHVYLIINAFNEAGYSVYFYKKRDFITFSRLGRYGRFIYTLKNVKFISELPENTKDIILVFDNIQEDLLSRQWEKLVYINVLKPSFCKVGELITIPFFMQPLRYYMGQHNNLLMLRSHERKIRVFFGGDTSEKWYQNPILKLQGHLTRSEALNALLESCPKAKYIEDIKELNGIVNSSQYLNECRIWRADWGNILSSRIFVYNWLHIVSRSDFFLCLSGTDFPMCHNAIESMAVGTIPIIAYHDWFTPPLEHRKNAIVFSGTDDLVRKVNEVFEMSAEEIREMRQNVIKYYEDHLNPQSFVRKFESSAKELNTLMLYPKLVCSDYDNKQAKILLDDLNINLQKHLKNE